MRTWWQKLERSALFIYLIQEHEFDLYPSESDHDFFAEEILKESENLSELRRFFGSYAYLAELFQKFEPDVFYIPIPGSIARVPIRTRPFSTDELQTISEYRGNYLAMNE